MTCPTRGIVIWYILTTWYVSIRQKNIFFLLLNTNSTRGKVIEIWFIWKFRHQHFSIGIGIYIGIDIQISIQSFTQKKSLVKNIVSLKVSSKYFYQTSFFDKVATYKLETCNFVRKRFAKISRRNFLIISKELLCRNHEGEPLWWSPFQ